MATRAPELLDQIIAATPGGESLRTCLQCGPCGGACPSAADMDHTPRHLFGLLAADLRDEVLASNTFWYCVSCYYCTVRCPQQIPITDVMYALKRRAIAAGYARRVDAGDFAHTFIGLIERYGRSYELGLATRFHLTHAPLSKVDLMGALALDMATRDRLALRPRRIRDLAGLRAILRTARALGQAAEPAAVPAAEPAPETTGGTGP
jgi:heterodisulfide reductase subunit C